jgi:hypothetical protein
MKACIHKALTSPEAGSSCLRDGCAARFSRNGFYPQKVSA